MRINFILPQNGNEPVGGYKVVYQYANYLSEKQHEVHIYFVILPNGNGLTYAISLLKRKVISMFNNKTRKVTWFKLAKGVRLHFNVIPHQVTRINSGKIVATFWKTAFLVNKSRVKKNNKFYLIQGFEVFAGLEERIIESWKLSLNKIVISKWLLQKLKSIGERAEYIPNFLDLNIWHHVTKKNSNPTVSMLWHENSRKGSKIGLEVIFELKRSIPDLEAILFGTSERPSLLPKWIGYFQNASEEELREKIYSQSDVYIMTSEFEGWGLTAMEAMAVGTAVVSTANGGIDEFSLEDKTVKKVSVGNFVEMKNAVFDLLIDKESRKRQEMAAIQMIKQFSLEESGQHFEKFLMNGNKEELNE